MLHRIALYPCCSADIAEPLQLLREFADDVIFCDLDPSLPQRWKETVAQLTGNLPRASFMTEDIRSAVERIERIDVVFYRGDSDGEGGSRIFVLGDSFLPKLLKRFPAAGGYIITDGSNSRGGNFKRMIRASGLTKHGWHFEKTADQPFVETHGLYVISVSALTSSSSAIAAGQP